MLRSLAVAISTYSKIPVPNFNWEEKDMEYSMVFFPVIGIFVGIAQYFLCLFCSSFQVGKILFAVLVTVLPLLITGGIHFDGYLDVCDAKSSYASKEKKLEILKDPHIGAFAIIHGIIYVLINFGVWVEIIEKTEGITKESKNFYLLLMMVYIISRILSGLSVVSFKKAKAGGMVSTMAKAQNKKVLWVLIGELMLALVLTFFYFKLQAFILWIPMGIAFIYYRLMSTKEFGGITGDLAGYFLQTAELFTLIVACVILLIF